MTRLGPIALLLATLASQGCHTCPFGWTKSCEGGRCVPVQKLETQSTWAFSERREMKCYLKPSSWHPDSCDGPTCSDPVPRTILVRKRVKTEEPVWKCEPACASAP